MKIKEAARLTGLTEKAIRLYEEKGLIVPDTRLVAGRVFREYPAETVDELRRIAILRRCGFSLQQIARIQCGQEQELEQVLAEYRTALLEELEQKQALAQALSHTVPRTEAELTALLEAPSAHLPVPQQDLRFSPPAPHVPSRLSFWYRHGVFPHRLSGTRLVVTALLWERKLDISALARLLNEKGLEFSGEKLAHLLHRLERQGVLHREEDSYTANVQAGHFCTWEPDDLVRILVNRGGDRMFYSSDAPMSVSSSPGSGAHI